MVDLDILKEKGITKASIKALFTAEVKTSKITELLRLISSRIDEGQNYNISNFRLYKALDTAWNVPLKQITPTMLQSLVDSNLSSEAMQNTLTTWGIDLNEIFVEVPDPKDPRRTLKKVNIPAFSRIFVPLCRAYVSIRRAKTMNDRKLVPYMKFEPAISNEETRMRCEVITSRVEQMANDYGFWKVEDDTFWNTLHYGKAFRFPVEEWHVEEQLVEKESDYIGETDPAPAPDNDDGKGDEKIDDKYKRVRMKEGLRYHIPHPTRTFYDMAWPTYTFNTDTGATYAGYWRVMRYGEISTKKAFFNLDVIKVGRSNEFFSNNTAFFDNVYPCRMQFPTMANDGVNENDSEKKVSDALYITTDHDKSLVLTELFQKLVPSEWGLGDYDFPVWFRFVVANNDVVIYCAPLPYTPMLFDDYDGISGQAINPSMTLEIMPFQDQFANLLSQYLLSVKQNLANMTLVDEDVINEEDISRLQKFSQSIWSALNFVRFSSRRFFKSQQQPNALFPQKFPQVDTNSIAIAMRTILEILERVLVMSAQELGQSASHEQTREEVRNIASNTSTRAQFTASTLDRSRQAWKKQVYEGLMAYGCEEGYAQVPADPKITQELLSKLGFTWEAYDTDKKRLTVSWTKDALRTAIPYGAFAANRDGDDRISDIEIARSLSAFMQQLAAIPGIPEALGPNQFIALANIIGRSAGLPRDFRLVNNGPDTTPQQQAQEIMTAVQQMLQQTEMKINQDVMAALEPLAQDVRAIEQAIGMVQGGQQQQEQAPPPEAEMPMMPPQDLPPGPPMA